MKKKELLMTRDIFIQKLINNAVESEKELHEVFLKDTDSVFYVKCPGDSDHYHQWLQFCTKCSGDHEPKFTKQKAHNLYIQVARNVDVKGIDIEGFLNRISEEFCKQQEYLAKELDPHKDEEGSFSQTLTVLSKPNDTSLNSLQTRSLQDFISFLNGAATKENLAEHIYQPNTQNFSQMKCVCPRQQQKSQQNRFINWLGKCEHCQEPSGHVLYAMNNQKNSNPAELKNSIKVKIIDLRMFKETILNEFKQMIQNIVTYRFTYHNKSLGAQVSELYMKKNNYDHLFEQLIEEKKQLSKDIHYSEEQTQKFEEQYHIEKNQRQELEDRNAEDVLKPTMDQSIFYDVEINCESILKLTADEGWEVKIPSNEYENKKKISMIVVAFYGLYNKGKSFLASKLSKKNLPLGYSVSTIGLSALYPSNLDTQNAVVFLDTAGTETPICYLKEDPIIEKLIKDEGKDLRENEQKNKMYEIKLKDRLLTENLIQKFVLTESNIVLLVVDQLTKEEQRLIQKIKNMYKLKDIIIVHNFSKLVQSGDVLKYIDTDILQSFSVKQSKLSFNELNLEGYYYVEKNAKVTHVVMAYDNSEVGLSYNPFCYQYLRSRILAQTNAKPFDMIQELTKMVAKQLPEIVDLPDDIKTVDVIYNQDSKSGYITTNVKSTGLKSISFDLLGDLKVFNGGLDPKYSININGGCLQLDVEICGPFHALEKDNNSKTNNNIIKCKNTEYSMIEWHGFRKGQDVNEKSQCIILRGSKDDLPVDPKVATNNREKGEFKVVVPIPAQYVLRDGNPKFIVSNGIISLTYDLQDTSEEDDFY